MPPADKPVPKDIADEAARWFADRDSGLLADEASLSAWLAADPRHARAFAEIEAVWSELGGATASPAVRASLDPAPRRRPVGTDRPWSGGAMRWAPVAAAASAALVVLGVWQDWPTRLEADAITGAGERRTIQLPDGSQVQLNTRTAVAFDYRADSRRIRLLSGEAAFDVAPDPGRPFVVESGGGSATALGTRFVEGACRRLAKVSSWRGRDIVGPRGRGFRSSSDALGCGIDVGRFDPDWGYTSWRRCIRFGALQSGAIDLGYHPPWG